MNMRAFTVHVPNGLAGMSLLATVLTSHAGEQGWIPKAAQEDRKAGATARMDASFNPVAARTAAPAATRFKTPLRLTSDPVPGSQTGGSQAPIGPSCSVTAVPADVLSLINAVRMTGGTCGAEKFGTTTALVWDERLFAAASSHSADMARRDYVDHVTPEGVDHAQRIEAAGYGWSRAGENIAAGNSSVEAVMAAWLKSEAHCRNLLNPSFTEVAVACVRAVPSSYGTYWTMKLGKR